jgi:hypothetical protein
VIKKSKRLEFTANNIAEHLKRGFRGEIQRYLALKPPNGDDLAALIQTAREAETMTLEPLDTTGIASQLKQMQAQIAKISIKPVINLADHENTDYNIPLPLPPPPPPPPPPRVVYRNAPQYEDNYMGPYNNNNSFRPRNRDYSNNMGGYYNSMRGTQGNFRGGYSNSTPAPDNGYSAAGEYKGGRGGYGSAPRGFTTNARYFSRGCRNAIGGQRPPLALMPNVSNPSLPSCRSCAGAYSHGTDNQCRAATLTCFSCG